MSNLLSHQPCLLIKQSEDGSGEQYLVIEAHNFHSQLVAKGLQVTTHQPFTFRLTRDSQLYGDYHVYMLQPALTGMSYKQFLASGTLHYRPVFIDYLTDALSTDLGPKVSTRFRWRQPYPHALKFICSQGRIHLATYISNTPVACLDAKEQEIATEIKPEFLSLFLKARSKGISPEITYPGTDTVLPLTLQDLNHLSGSSNDRLYKGQPVILNLDSI